MECAAANDHIRVNTIHPGIIDTPIWSKMPNGGMFSGSNAAADPNQLAALSVPIGTVGTAQDIANSVLFLASDASSYMTASEIVIDGGIFGGGMPRRGTTSRAGEG